MVTCTTLDSHFADTVGPIKMEIFGDKGTTKRDTLQFPREKVTQFRRGQTESYFLTGDDVGVIKGKGCLDSFHRASPDVGSPDVGSVWATVLKGFIVENASEDDNWCPSKILIQKNPEFNDLGHVIGQEGETYEMEKCIILDEKQTFKYPDDARK